MNTRCCVKRFILAAVAVHVLASVAVAEVANYWVDLSVVGGGTLSATSGWYQAGTSLAITATPSAGWALYGWSGEVEEATAPGEALCLTVDRSRAITAHFAPVRHVSTTGNNANDGLTWGTALASVATACAAFSGTGMVLVAEGVYTNATELTITYPIRLVSSNGWEHTTLTLNPAASGKRLLTLNHAGAAVCGFTLTGGLLGGYYLKGSGAQILAGTVMDCRITGNSDGKDKNNTCGTGVAVLSANSLAIRCVIDNNNATSNPRGGGVYVSGGGRIKNCLIADNVANYGGGVYFDGGGTIRNCTIAGNTAATTGGGLDVGITVRASRLKTASSTVTSRTTTPAPARRTGTERIPPPLRP